MQYIVALLIAGLAAWVITLIGSGTIERAASAFGLLVGGWRDEPWPRGVQEEDRDRPWGARIRHVVSVMAGPPIEETTAAVQTSPIRSRTRPR
jgi:hypothetical protein